MKVLDMVEDVKLSGNRDFKFELINEKFVRLYAKEERKKETKKVSAIVTDFGGNTEYYLSCRLFFTENALYVITFEAATITESTYFTKVGSFVDVVLGNCTSPIICLVAAKSDESKRTNFSFVADLVAAQIDFFTGRANHQMKVHLVDEVLVTSSKFIDKRSLKIASDIFASLLSNKKLIHTHLDSIPLSWHLLQKEIINNGKVELSLLEVDEMFADLERTVTTDEVDKARTNQELKTLGKLNKMLVENLSIALSNENTTENEGNTNMGRIEQELVPENIGEVKEQLNIQAELNIHKKEAPRSNTIVDFFADLGIILRFKKIKKLENKIIAQLMNLIKILR